MPNSPIEHFEWTTRDTQRLTTFFGKVFGWTFFEPMPGYTMIAGVGGIFQATDPKMPVGMTPYVTVTNLAETEKRIAAAGGRIFKSKEEVPGRGWFTIFGDPDGNVVAAWQAMPKSSKPKQSKPKQSKPKPAPKKKKR